MSSSGMQPRSVIGRETANDQFKRGFSSWMWGSMVAATAVHFGLFAFWPELEAKGVYGTVTEEFEMVELPPEVVIPPPPQAIARPATPVVSVADIPDDITIAPTTFESNPVENLPPPTPAANDAMSDFVAFAPSMVRPEFRNRGAIESALVRHYPPHLRDAGIGGTVNVNFWIDETGKVVKYEVAKSSGYEAFDQAAGKVADIMQFSPAMNRNQTVRVVVTFPITFRVN
jgi:protein TonB